jgi:integrase
MTKIRLQYINSYRDRHGKMRWYFRRAGFKKVALPGAVGSAEFMAAYQSALASASPMMTEIGASRTKPGTVAAAVVAYYNSREFRGLAAETQRGRRSILERLRKEYGDGPIATLQRHHIEQMLARIPTPAAARLFFVALRQVLGYAARMGMRRDDPTIGIKRPRLKSDGVYCWSDEDVKKFEATHPVGTRARLALALGVYLGQRNNDTIKLGWQHLRLDPENPGRYIIRMRQHKTGRVLDIPVHGKLQAILDVTPRTQMTFLLTRLGKPFARPTAFANWFRTQCDVAGLPGQCVFHGLRKVAARKLAEAGASTLIIASVTGHASLAEIARYTRQVDQLRLARRGIDLVS